MPVLHEMIHLEEGLLCVDGLSEFDNFPHQPPQHIYDHQIRHEPYPENDWMDSHQQDAYHYRQRQYHHHQQHEGQLSSPEFSQGESPVPYIETHTSECVPLSIFAPSTLEPFKYQERYNISVSAAVSHDSVKVKASTPSPSPRLRHVEQEAVESQVAVKLESSNLTIVKPDSVIIKTPQYISSRLATPSSCSDSEGNCSSSSVPRRRGGSVHKRHTLTADQADVLITCFERQRFLQPNQAQDLANRLGMTTTQIKIWYQNRRAYGKRKIVSGARQTSSFVMGEY
ncbi:UNVERIFIED_CONTAM: hypothetical protein HDU68_008158 [Siphonaria sp. JEL0065]|nr:hypothetical protein HDU68_008158 [Siphonaria sp. JEL0065]